MFSAPNYTICPNDLIDYYMADMGGAELKVVLAIVRHTFGYHKKQEALTLETLQEITGLCERSVIEATRMTEERGLIKKMANPKHRYGATWWEVNISQEADNTLEEIREKVKKKRKREPTPEKVGSHSLKSREPAPEKVGSEPPPNIIYKEREKETPKEAKPAFSIPKEEEFDTSPIAKRFMDRFSSLSGRASHGSTYGKLQGL